jgi:hypothetical protein
VHRLLGRFGELRLREHVDGVLQLPAEKVQLPLFGLAQVTAAATGGKQFCFEKNGFGVTWSRC